jgi:hypothetical protein
LPFWALRRIIWGPIFTSPLLSVSREFQTVLLYLPPLTRQCQSILRPGASRLSMASLQCKDSICPVTARTIQARHCREAERRFSGGRRMHMKYSKGRAGVMLPGLVRHMTKCDESWIQVDEAIIALILRLGGRVSKGLSH